MRMNRKSKNSSDIMDRMDASSEMTRFLSDDQYLIAIRTCIWLIVAVNWRFLCNYLVTLNTRSRRRARSTEKPNEPPSTYEYITSNTEPLMT